MNISKKLAISYFIIIALIAISSYISIHYIREGVKTVDSIYNHPFTVTKAARDIQFSITKIHRNMKDIVLAQNSVAHEHFKDLINEEQEAILKHFDTLNDRYLGDKTQVLSLKEEFRKWEPIRNEVISLLEKNQVEAAAEITRGKGARHVKRLEDGIRQLIAFADNKAQSFREKAQKGHSLSIMILSFTFILQIVVAVSITIISTRHVGRPLTILADTMKTVAEGNLDAELLQLSRKDEIGILNSGFNEMVQNLKSKSDEMGEGVIKLHSLSSRLLGSVASLSATSAQTGAAVNETTVTVEEVNQTALVNAEYANEVSINSSSSTEVAESGKSATYEMIEDVELINERMKSIESAVSSLREKSAAIEDIVDSVSDIADQSKILSVNANIEAVKAGDYGAGFSVVANEIKLLAQQSQESTTAIRKLISEIQNSVNQVTRSTEEGSNAVTSGIRKSKMARDAIENLIDSVNESAQSSERISLTSREQQEGMKQIAAAMKNIEDAMQRSVETNKSVDIVTQELKKVADSLKARM